MMIIIIIYIFSERKLTTSINIKFTKMLKLQWQTKYNKISRVEHIVKVKKSWNFDVFCPFAVAEMFIQAALFQEIYPEKGHVNKYQFDLTPTVDIWYECYKIICDINKVNL